jgi:hypothetical protein
MADAPASPPEILPARPDPEAFTDYRVYLRAMIAYL